jgi:hypothetical protein
MNPKKIQYHLRSKQASMDKSNPNILTSSPVIETTTSKLSKIPSYMLDKNLHMVK